MARKAAAGSGSIRKVEKTKNGKKYTYWEGRYSKGFDPGTGKQIQKAVYGKTQKEVATKLREITKDLAEGTFIEPNKMTLAAWLTIWQDTYLRSVKPSTEVAYKTIIKKRIIPAIGAVAIDALRPDMVQSFYNALLDGSKEHSPLNAKTVRNVHGVLHRALKQAVKVGNLRVNPCDAVELPKVTKKKIEPMTESQTTAFLKAIRGHRFEDIFTVTLFTGMRESEAIGLTWSNVNFERSQITIDHQLQRVKGEKWLYQIMPTKSSNVRTITAAPFVMQILKSVRHKQLENKMRYADVWMDSDFVFTNEYGDHFKQQTLFKDFKKVVESIGASHIRYHDLRHTYAVASLRMGDDIKTLQENLGHATASFTLDVYGHVTEKMKQESANRMQKFINAVNK